MVNIKRICVETDAIYILCISPENHVHSVYLYQGLSQTLHTLSLQRLALKQSTYKTLYKVYIPLYRGFHTLLYNSTTLYKACIPM